jgi:cytochrome c
VGVQTHAAVTPATALTASETAMRQCVVCHPTDASGLHGVGPSLFGVAGRERASAPGYSYSEALRARGGAWSPQELDAFIADPAKHVPGTKMPFAGLKDAADRAQVIEMLSKLR